MARSWSWLPRQAWEASGEAKARARAHHTPWDAPCQCPPEAPAEPVSNRSRAITVYLPAVVSIGSNLRVCQWIPHTCVDVCVCVGGGMQATIVVETSWLYTTWKLNCLHYRFDLLVFYDPELSDPNNKVCPSRAPLCVRLCVCVFHCVGGDEPPFRGRPTAMIC